MTSRIRCLECGAESFGDGARLACGACFDAQSVALAAARVRRGPMASEREKALQRCVIAWENAAAKVLTPAGRILRECASDLRAALLLSSTAGQDRLAEPEEEPAPAAAPPAPVCEHRFMRPGDLVCPECGWRGNVQSVVLGTPASREARASTALDGETHDAEAPLEPRFVLSCRNCGAIWTEEHVCIGRAPGAGGER